MDCFSIGSGLQVQKYEESLYKWLANDRILDRDEKKVHDAVIR